MSRAKTPDGIRVVFLDIDGVLVTARYSSASGHEWADPVCLRELQKLLAEVPRTRIVVSSLWGEYALQILPMWGITTRILGISSLYDERNLTRGAQIVSWLNSYDASRSMYPLLPKIDGYVILDDNDDMGSVSPRLVRTTYAMGFTSVNRKQAKKILLQAV